MASSLDITGKVLERGSDEYEKARQRTHASNAWTRPNSSPLLIAQPTSPQDVVACLTWAASRDIQVTVRSGGHNWFGISLQQDTLLLDMSAFDGVQIDPTTKTATVGPCATGQRLNEAAAKHGLCFPAGHCPSVPMGGFLLGGGLGWFMDHYGVAAESIRSVTIVTPKGEVLENVTPDTHPDWMWLVRGAAAAFPGVVTSFQLQLYDLPPIVRSVMSFHPIDKYASIVEFLCQARVATSISPKVEVAAVLACTPPPLAEALAQTGSTPPDKVCIVMVSAIADTEEEFTNQMASTVKHPDFPSTPLVPMEEPEDNSFSGLSEPVGPIYPEGLHWMACAYQLETKKADSVDWDGVRASFEDNTPMGGSHAITVCGYEREITEPSFEGAYGPVSYSGIFIATYGAYTEESDEDTMNQLRRFETTSAACIEPHLAHYSVLEHQLNKDTFPKTFVGPTGTKLQKLRKTMDPDGLFFDPTEAPAW